MKERRFSWLQFDATPEVTTVVRNIGYTIDPEDLVASGLETRPHITVLYGFKQNTFEELGPILLDWVPCEWTLMPLSVFKNKNADVLKLGVSSPGLMKMHERLSSQIKHLKTFEFNPHITVAYLKPGRGEKYVDFDVPPWHNLTTKLVLHARDRGRHEWDWTDPKQHAGASVRLPSPSLLF